MTSQEERTSLAGAMLVSGSSAILFYSALSNLSTRFRLSVDGATHLTLRSTP